MNGNVIGLLALLFLGWINICEGISRADLAPILFGEDVVLGQATFVTPVVFREVLPLEGRMLVGTVAGTDVRPSAY